MGHLNTVETILMQYFSVQLAGPVLAYPMVISLVDKSFSVFVQG
jgi:hypothetical protein